VAQQQQQWRISWRAGLEKHMHCQQQGGAAACQNMQPHHHAGLICWHGRWLQVHSTWVQYSDERPHAKNPQHTANNKHK
jgi:hypothetical protein